MQTINSSIESEYFVPERPSRVETVLERIKKLEGIDRYSALAALFKVTTGTVANWKKRDTIPYEHIHEYARRRGVSLEWLFHGNPPVFTGKLGVSEEGAIYKVRTDQDAVYEISEMVFAAAQESGRNVDPRKLKETVRLLHRDYLAEGKMPAPAKIEGLIQLLI